MDRSNERIVYDGETGRSRYATKSENEMYRLMFKQTFDRRNVSIRMLLHTLFPDRKFVKSPHSQFSPVVGGFAYYVKSFSTSDVCLWRRRKERQSKEWRGKKWNYWMQISPIPSSAAFCVCHAWKFIVVLSKILKHYISYSDTRPTRFLVFLRELLLFPGNEQTKSVLGLGFVWKRR